MNSKDPFSILGLPADAPLATIDERYRELIQRYPPDLDPAAFEAIRDAYQKIQDPERRAEDRLFGPPPLADLDELIDLLAGRRRPLGAEVWRRQLVALRKLKKKPCGPETRPSPDPFRSGTAATPPPDPHP